MGLVIGGINYDDFGHVYEYKWMMSMMSLVVFDHMTNNLVFLIIWRRLYLSDPRP